MTTLPYRGLGGLTLTGIYAIVNPQLARLYIGQSVNIPERWNSHVKTLDDGTHKNKDLLNDWKDGSPDDFTFCVLEETAEANLKDRERDFLKLYQPEFDLYNKGWSPRPILDLPAHERKRVWTDRRGAIWLKLPQCRWCSKSFYRTRADKVHCSEACYKADYRDNKRAA